MRNFKARCVRVKAADSLWKIEKVVREAKFSLDYAKDRKVIYELLEKAIYECQIGMRDLYRTSILK